MTDQTDNEKMREISQDLSEISASFQRMTEVLDRAGADIRQMTADMQKEVDAIAKTITERNNRSIERLDKIAALLDEMLDEFNAKKRG